MTDERRMTLLHRTPGDLVELIGMLETAGHDAADEARNLRAERDALRERVACLVNLSALQMFERGAYAETQYYTGVDVGMSVAYTRAEDEALVNQLRDTFAQLVAERDALRARLNDALAWLGMNGVDLHPAAAADLHGILTGQPVATDT